MSIVKQRNSNGVVAVYEQKKVYDKETKKYKTKRTYLGTWKDGHLVPTSGKKGRPKKKKVETIPVKVTKEMSKDVQIQYLEAEVTRLEGLLKDVLESVQTLLGPTIAQMEERDRQRKEEQESKAEQIEMPLADQP